MDLAHRQPPSGGAGGTFFVTTIAFRPTLQQQRDDAERKGQVGRQKIFDGLLTRLDNQEAGQ